MAYVRVLPEKREVGLLTNNTTGSDERLISSRKFAELYFPLSRLAWSENGKSIILAARADKDRSTLVEVPLAGGPDKVLTTHDWTRVEDPVWLADHSGLVFAATEPDRIRNNSGCSHILRGRRAALPTIQIHTGA